MNLRNRFLQDKNGNKAAPITVPNAIRWPDGSNLNDKLSAFVSVVIEAPVNATSAALPITSLTCEVGKYYRIDIPVTTLAVTLPAMTDTTTVRTVVLMFRTDSVPAVTFSSTAPTGGIAPVILYQDGFEIAANKMYEVNCLWNGFTWIIASIEIVRLSEGEGGE